MDRLALRTFLCYLLFLVFTGTTGQWSQCGNGWFNNNCQYQCHCLNGTLCDRLTGECPGGCEKGWFGPQCQYRDAAYNALVKLTDGSDFTCLLGGELYQTFKMLDDVMFTWMRIVTNRPGLFDRVNMTFISSSETEVDPKSTLKNIDVTDTVLEVYGELQSRFKYIRLVFDKLETKQSFCSMQVSSGRNVAIKQTASQSSTYLSGAEKAVDGKSSKLWNQGSCSSTELEESPYWTLNLSLPVIVNMYKLLSPQDWWTRCRLQYFRLESYYESTKVQQYDHTSGVDQIIDVYSENASSITSVMLHLSTSFWPRGQYYCEKNIPSVSFCEMQIYGDVVCQQGKWGRDCEKDCNCRNSSESCFVSTGMCPSGCKAGFYGPGCQEECLNGRWGVDCRNKCGNCWNGNCNKISGECPNGCLTGYKLHHCVEKCDPGFYGYNCSQTCPRICLNNMCDNVDGSCAKCPSGSQGPLCNRECSDGQWGISCLNNCDKCLNGKCNTVSGECLSGCVQGYKMPFCVEECDLGFHGYNCIYSCPENCRNKTCNKVDGLCIECKAGYQGPLCAQVCDATYYGQNCSSPCSEMCIDQLCHHITGVCEKCPYGKQISKDCSQDCDAGFHGFNCIQPCPANCQDNICDNVDGKCTKCVAGFQGLVCNQVCVATFYGEDCSIQCSDKCIDELCHHITGVCDNCPDGKQISKDCSQDCYDGFFGPRCANQCSGYCGGDGFCNNINGSCLSGCKPGYTSDNCEQPCAHTTYGEGCNKTCNVNCVVNATQEPAICEHVNGQCLLGCISGYSGITCEETTNDLDNVNLVIILVPLLLVLIVVTALVIGLCLWRRRKGLQTDGTPMNGCPVELEEIIPPTLQHAVDDNYDKISLHLSEGNPHTDETERSRKLVNEGRPTINEYGNTNLYMNEANPPYNEYEKIDENRQSHIYTEPED